MLIIRLSRIGKKNYAQYKLVLAEKTYPVQGKFIEQLGSYDPHQKKTKINKERVLYWIKNGAQCSDSVHNLLLKNGIIEGGKRVIRISKKKGEEAGEKSEEAVKEEGALNESEKKASDDKEEVSEKEKQIEKSDEKETDKKEEDKKEEASKNDNVKNAEQEKKEEEKK